jgi:hypothetical protein
MGWESAHLLSLRLSILLSRFAAFPLNLPCLDRDGKSKAKKLSREEKGTGEEGTEGLSRSQVATIVFMMDHENIIKISRKYAFSRSLFPS